MFQRPVSYVSSLKARKDMSSHSSETSAHHARFFSHHFSCRFSTRFIVSRIAVASLSFGLSCVDLLTPTALHIPTALAAQPALAAQSSSEELTCDETYSATRYLTPVQELSPDVRSPLHQATAALSSQAWFNVALLCPQRFAEGIILSSLNAAEISGNSFAEFSTSAGLSSDADASAYALSTALSSESSESESSPESTSTTILHSSTLQSLAISEDKARFAYEIMATRNFSEPSLLHQSVNFSILADGSSSASETFAYAAQIAPSGGYNDTRQRVYDADSVINYSGIDSALGIRTSLASAIKADTALTQIQVIDKDADTYTSTSSHDSSVSTRFKAIAQRIRSHMVRALAWGMPRVSGLYLSK